MALNNIRAFEVIWENGLQFIHHQMFQIKILIRKCDFLPQVQFGSKVWSGADQIFDPHGISKRIIHSSINILIQKHPHSGKKKKASSGGGLEKEGKTALKVLKPWKNHPLGRWVTASCHSCFLFLRFPAIRYAKEMFMNLLRERLPVFLRRPDRTSAISDWTK